MVYSRSLLNMGREPPEITTTQMGVAAGFSTSPPWLPCRSFPARPASHPGASRAMGLSVPPMRPQAFSIVHSSGCWLSLEYSLTCATFDSATSRVKTPQTPRPRVWTCSMTWVAFVRFLRSEEHTSELQSLMSISYAVFCLKKKILNFNYTRTPPTDDQN